MMICIQVNVTLSWLQTESTKEVKTQPKQVKVAGNQENKRKAIVFNEDTPATKRAHGNGNSNGASYKPNRQLYQAPRGGGRFRSKW